jgi:hypothetical protein
MGGKVLGDSVVAHSASATCFDLECYEVFGGLKLRLAVSEADSPSNFPGFASLQVSQKLSPKAASVVAPMNPPFNCEHNDVFAMILYLLRSYV